MAESRLPVDGAVEAGDGHEERTRTEKERKRMETCTLTKRKGHTQTWRDGKRERKEEGRNRQRRGPGGKAQHLNFQNFCYCFAEAACRPLAKVYRSTIVVCLMSFSHSFRLLWFLSVRLSAISSTSLCLDQPIPLSPVYICFFPGVFLFFCDGAQSDARAGGGCNAFEPSSTLADAKPFESRPTEKAHRPSIVFALTARILLACALSLSFFFPCFYLHKSLVKRLASHRMHTTPTAPDDDLPLCQNCEDDLALLRCTTCCAMYCRSCGEVLHKSAKMRSHTMVRLQRKTVGQRADEQSAGCKVQRSLLFQSHSHVCCSL